MKQYLKKTMVISLSFLLIFFSSCFRLLSFFTFGFLSSSFLIFLLTVVQLVGDTGK